MLSEALEHLVRGIVDNPDDVEVSSRNNRRGELLEVRVNPEDLGRVIGRNGRTAKALRSVMSALATQGSVRVDRSIVKTSEGPASWRVLCFAGTILLGSGLIGSGMGDSTCS